jgi:hypothetical protein
MSNNLNLGTIVYGGSLFEVSVELIDISGAAYPFPTVSDATKAATAKIAQQIITEYGKKRQELGTPERLSDEGFQIGTVTIQHEDAETAATWDLFKKTLIGGTPELPKILADRGFGLRMQPLRSEKYFPVLERILHKLDKKISLDKDEANEFQWFTERSGYQDQQIIRLNIAHYFMRTEPSLRAILTALQEGKALSEIAQKKFATFKAWDSERRALEKRNIPTTDQEWLAALLGAVKDLENSSGVDYDGNEAAYS